MVHFKKVALAYVSGVLAAFSPCVIVLIPLLLYRFLGGKKKQAASGPSDNEKKSKGVLSRCCARLCGLCGLKLNTGYQADIRTIGLFVLGFQCSYLVFGCASSLSHFVGSGLADVCLSCAQIFSWCIAHFFHTKWVPKRFLPLFFPACPAACFRVCITFRHLVV